MAKQPRTWIVAADGRSAHIFERADGGLKSVCDLKPDEGGTETEISNSTVGRTGSSPTGRHKYEPSMNQGRQHELAFAHQVAIVLNDATSRDAFEQVVIVAAPQMLGLLREGLTEKARQRVTVAVNKEFANVPAPAMQEALLGILRDPDIMSGRNGLH